jgi:phytoene synthase
LSFSESQAVTRKSASNLALSFVLLPRARRAAMAVLYALCREVDDVADDVSVPVETRRTRLAAWRSDILAACQSGSPRFPVAKELQTIVRQYKLPFVHFDELIKGVEMDLEINRYPDLPALEQYCYRVASVVGLLSIEVFGYRNAGCREYAILLGKALQLTNILRDVRTDAERGRIYLPQSELTRFKVTEAEILDFRYSSRFAALAGSLASRARDFYRRARETLPLEDRRAMATAELMGCVYWRLLKKLESRQFMVFGTMPTRLGRGHKLFLVIRTWWRLTRGAFVPSYGIP